MDLQEIVQVQVLLLLDAVGLQNFKVGRQNGVLSFIDNLCLVFELDFVHDLVDLHIWRDFGIFFHELFHLLLSAFAH